MNMFRATNIAEHIRKMHKKYCQPFEKRLLEDGMYPLDCACEHHAHLCDLERRDMFTMKYPVTADEALNIKPTKGGN